MLKNIDYTLLADEVLLRLMKRSDERAFDTIFERYWTRIFTIAYRKTRSKEVAEDLTQTLFANLWDKRHSSQIEHLSRYLSVGIKNSIINYINAEMIRHGFHAKTSVDMPEAVAADHLLILKDLQQMIEQALSQLPERTRVICKLSKFEKYSIKEIAFRFGLTEKAVEYHITQSNKVLRAHLKDYLSFETLLACISLLSGSTANY